MAESSWIRIKLVSPEEEAAETLARIEGLSAKLWAILQTQIRARVQDALEPGRNRRDHGIANEGRMQPTSGHGVL